MKGKVVLENELVGIDVRRTHAAQMQNITKEPVFNEFDKFVPYDGLEFENCTLYVVQPQVFNAFLKSNKCTCIW